MSTKKRTFLLKNINISEIIQKFKLTDIDLTTNQTSNQCNNNTFLPLITHISHIIEKEPEMAFSFYDEKKRQEKCLVTMIDHLSFQKLNEYSFEKNCFWCRHSIKTTPIGCPIKYVNSIVEKSYVSNLTNEKYYMNEHITHKKISENILNLDENKNLLEKNYYLVDGFFCSFNCVAAFIQDNKKTPLYNESYSLLKCLYYDLMNTQIKKLQPAPHWRLLKIYGGHMTIEEFRNLFKFPSPEFIFTITDKSCLKPISNVYKILN